MRNRFVPILIICIATLTNCSSGSSEFPVDKRYWSVKDYENITLKLRYGRNDNTELPTFNNPENSKVVEKLTDQDNFKVILDDQALGLKHRNNIAEDFFAVWRDMNGIYRARDRTDMYIHEMEMLAVWHFGLGLQLRYFELGNENIKQGADDPNSVRIQRTLNSNINTLVENYLIYLDEINDESSYSNEGKVKLAQGIDQYFKDLIELYPNADYSSLKRKAELLLKKCQSPRLNESLTNLINWLEEH